LRTRGIQPMALLSMMARLGSAKPVELAESIDELAEGFDLSDFGAAPAKFDAGDLFPLTARINRGLDYSAVADRITALGVPTSEAERFWQATRENITVLDDLSEWWVLFRDGADPAIDSEDREFVTAAMAMLPECPFTDSTWGEWTSAVGRATGRKGRGLFMPLRKALTGRSHGPDMSRVMPLLRVVKARGTGTGPAA